MLSEIPESLITSMVVASILFWVAVLLLVHLANKNWSTTLKIGVGLGAWYSLVFVLGRFGFFGMDPLFAPNIAFGFIAVFFILKRLYSSTFIQQAFEAIPLHWVMAVQIFRVMGYGFITFWQLGLLPGEFALPTGYGDVIVGLAAPLVAFLYYKRVSFSRQLAIVWNFIGIADLTMALTLGISTYPRPVQLLPAEPTNEPIALFPLVMVPLFAVPLSLLLHLLSLRVLKRGS